MKKPVKAAKKPAAPKPFKPFKAADAPDQDYRGEKLVKGVKTRV